MAKKEITALAKKLINFKTTSNNIKELNRCIDFIKSYLPKNLIIKKYIKNKKPSLVITFSKTKKPELFLACHIDVVPAAESLFIPKIKGNRLYARGGYDDKGSAAALLCLMRDYAIQGKKPSFGLIMTSDEETGGENGIGFLLKKGYKSNFAIIPDGGKNFNIVIKQKGILGINLIAKGKSAHGSKPWKGDNAIEKLMKAYLEIKKVFPKTTPKNRWKATLNLGRTKGGDVANKVPDYAEAELNIRYTEKESPEKIVKKIKNKIKKIKGIKIKLCKYKKPLVVNKNNIYITKLKKALEESLSKKLKFEYEHGASDASFFSEAKIPAVLVMPIGEDAHSKNEYINLKSLHKFYEAIKFFIDGNIKNE